MKLSIIIVNWNTRALLEQCLDSVFDHPPQCEFEVWVVDNASTDGSVEMVRRCFPQVRLIENRENVGFARANNQALEHCSGDFVLLLNSDTVMPRDGLQKLLACLDACPEAGACGPMLVNPDGSFQASSNDFPTLLTELCSLTGLASWVYGAYFPSHNPDASSASHFCDWVGGACLLVRSAAVRQVGVLDTRYFMYAEEVDWCYRFHQAGWRVRYCAEVRVVHYGGGSAKRATSSQLQRLYASKARFLERRYGSTAASIFRTAVRVVAACQAGRWAMWGTMSPSGNRERAASYWQLVWMSL